MTLFTIKKKLIKVDICVVVFVFFLSFSSFSQSKDSVQTKFLKGKWLTGLSGSISSNSTKILGTRSIINNFGLNIESGKFVKNRLLFGGKFQTQRRHSRGSIEDVDETIYIGPFMNYYFMDSNTGSLFTSISLGYIRYRQESTSLQVQPRANEIAQGGGLGAIFRVGYSYTMNSFVVFDLGVNLDIYNVGVKQTSTLSQNIQEFNVESSNLSLSFGFNVLLDKFFF